MVEKLTLLWIYLLHLVFFFIMEIIILVFFKTPNSLYIVWKLFFQCNMSLFLILIFFSSLSGNLETVPNRYKSDSGSFCFFLQSCQVRLIFCFGLMPSFSSAFCLIKHALRSRPGTSHFYMGMTVSCCVILFQANNLKISENGQEVSSL